jgi:LemA protein
VWAVRIVAILAVLFVIAETVFQFNRLASWNTIVVARKADVDREYKRRQNLLPNLVLAVSQYASYEQGVFRYVADARKALKMIRSGDVPKTRINGMLEQLLPRLVALAEQYPDLKTAGAVQDLITETTKTENRIADAKKEYNKAAEVYNQYISIVPGNLFAFVFDFNPAQYMGLNEDARMPVIDLNVTEEIAADR